MVLRALLVNLEFNNFFSADAICFKFKIVHEMACVKCIIFAIVINCKVKEVNMIWELMCACRIIIIIIRSSEFHDVVCKKIWILI